MKKIVYKNLAINYFDNETESLSTIIFIHGNSHSLRSFRHQLNEKELNQYRLIAIDLPGHGLSDKSEQYDLTFFVDSLKHLITELKIENFILVGHSLGGHIAIEALTELQPKGLIILGTPPLAQPFTIAPFLTHESLPLLFQNELSLEQMRSLMNSFYTDYELTDFDLAEFQKTDKGFREKMSQSFTELKFENELVLLNEFRGPKAVIHGSQDRLVNEDYLQQMIETQSLWRGGIQKIDSSHNLHVESFEKFNKLVIEFSEEVFQTQILFSSSDNKVIIEQQGIFLEHL